MTPKQKILIEHAQKNDGIFTKAEALNLVGDQCHREEKYVGEILARMLNAGLIERIGRGVYQIKERQNEGLWAGQPNN